MTDAELLDMMQNTCIVVDLDIATAGERDKSIPAGQRKDLSAVMAEVRAAFEDNSIKFGYRRLILASMFETVVMQAGAARQKLKTLLPNLNDEQRAGFKMDFIYEPVPNGTGFAMLPPHFSGALIEACNKRQVSNYYDGIDLLLAYTRSSCLHYFERVRDFDKSSGEEGAQKVVLRNIVVTRLQERLRLLATYNITLSERIQLVTNAGNVILSHDTDKLRKDAQARADVLTSANYIFKLLTDMVMGEDEGGAGEGSDTEA